jgi:hypothetical protein
MARIEKTVQEYMQEMTDHKKLVDKQMRTAKVATSHMRYREFVRYITSNPRKKAPKTRKVVTLF